MDSDPHASLEQAISKLHDEVAFELQTRPDRLGDAGDEGLGRTMFELSRAATHDLNVVLALTTLALSQQQQISALWRTVEGLSRP